MMVVMQLLLLLVDDDADANAGAYADGDDVKCDAASDGAGDEDQELTPLLKNADPEFEKLLEEEEQIERATRTQSQTPNFRPGDD